MKPTPQTAKKPAMEKEKPRPKKGTQKRKVKKHYPNAGRRKYFAVRKLNAKEKRTIRETWRRLGGGEEWLDYWFECNIEYAYDGDFTICLLHGAATVFVGVTKRSPLEEDNLVHAKTTALAKVLRLYHAAGA